MTGTGIQAEWNESHAAELSEPSPGLTLSPHGHCGWESPQPVWASASALCPASLSEGDPGSRGRGSGPCSYPSCPKVMFSLNRRLSSRSSCVMWHHFSLQAQGTGEGVQSATAPSHSPPGSDLRRQRYPRRASPHRKPTCAPTLPEGPPLTNVTLPKMRRAQSSDIPTDGRGRVLGGCLGHSPGAKTAAPMPCSLV